MKPLSTFTDESHFGAICPADPCKEVLARHTHVRVHTYPMYVCIDNLKQSGHSLHSEGWEKKGSKGSGTVGWKWFFTFLTSLDVWKEKKMYIVLYKCLWQNNSNQVLHQTAANSYFNSSKTEKCVCHFHNCWLIDIYFD